jgi:hypothetical protein
MDYNDYAMTLLEFGALFFVISSTAARENST